MDNEQCESLKKLLEAQSTKDVLADLISPMLRELRKPRKSCCEIWLEEMEKNHGKI